MLHANSRDRPLRVENCMYLRPQSSITLCVELQRLGFGFSYAPFDEVAGHIGSTYTYNSRVTEEEWAKLTSKTKSASSEEEVRGDSLDVSFSGESGTGKVPPQLFHALKW